jgi:hypothetical protein
LHVLAYKSNVSKLNCQYTSAKTTSDATGSTDMPDANTNKAAAANTEVVNVESVFPSKQLPVLNNKKTTTKKVDKKTSVKKKAQK